MLVVGTGIPAGTYITSINKFTNPNGTAYYVINISQNATVSSGVGNTLLEFYGTNYLFTQADEEGVEVRFYSVIYKAIEEYFKFNADHGGVSSVVLFS